MPNVSERNIVIGDTLNGTLNLGQRVRYSFDLDSLQTLRIFLDGQTLSDSYLRVYDNNNRLIAFNDDGGGNLDSLIQQQFSAGHYTIEAAAYADRFRGTYSLSMSSLTPASPTSPTTPIPSASTNAISSTIGTDSGLSTSIQSGGITHDNTLALSGTLSSGSSIALYDGDTLLSQYSQTNPAWTVQDSQWHYTTSALSDGNHTITARFTASDGSSSSQSISARIDTVATGSISTTLLTDTGASTSISNGGATTDHTLGLSGTAEAGSTVLIYDDSILLGNATLNGTAWSYNTPSLTDGSHSFTAHITDSAGNTVVTNNVSASLSTPATSAQPAIHIGDTLNGTLNLGQRVRYSFDLDSLQTLRIFLDGQTLSDSYLRVYDNNNRLIAFNDDGGGNLDSLIQQQFSAGHYTIEAAAYADRFRGTYSLSMSSLTPASPTSPTTPIPSASTNAISSTIGTDSGLSTSIQSGGITHDNTLALSGTLSSGSSIALYDGDTLLSQYSQTNPAWTVQDSQWHYTTSALSDGNHTITARFTASDGSSSSQSISARIDTVATGSISTTLLTDTGASTSISNGGATTDHTLGLSGTAEAGSTVLIYDDSILLGNATLNGTAWSYNTPSLTDGSHSFTAHITDSAGNTVVTNNVSASLSTPATSAQPAIHIGDTLNGTLNLGQRVRYSFDLDSLQTLRIFLDGQTLSDSYLRVYDNNNRLIAFNDDGGGNLDSLIQQQFSAGHYTIEAAAYADRFRGTYSLSMSSLTPASPTSPTTPIPSASTNAISSTIGTDSGLSTSIQSGGITHDNTLALSGTLSSGSSIALYDGDTLLSQYSQTNPAWTVQDSQWHYTTSALSDGNHTITARFTASDGSSSSQSISARIDTVATGSISTTLLTDTGASTSISNGGATTDHTLGLSGTAEAGSTVLIYDDSILLGNATLNGTAWSYNTPSLTDGSHSFTAHITDSAGNTVVTNNVSASLSTPAAPTTPAFTIDIVFSGDTSYQHFFTEAAARWSSIITEDVPDYLDIDDLRITAQVSAIDGAGQVLGQAGVTGIRPTLNLPYAGTMAFDSADIVDMVNNNTFEDVVLHEMGHLLGLSSYFYSSHSLLDPNNQYHYTGQNALARYQSITGTDASYIQLETGGGSGTAGSHWSEEIFGTELMTGYAESSGNMPLSAITIGALEDLGYHVDYSRADAYTLNPQASHVLAA